MRLPGLLTLTAAALLSSSTVYAAERSTVHLFQYGGANAPEKQVAFLDFRDLMEEKLPRLSRELLQERMLTSAGKLSLVPVLEGERLARPSERIASHDARRAYWRETGALALLTGRVKTTADRMLAIKTTFFWGDLEDGGATAIDLELPFSSTVFDTTNDSHSVAILYALAASIGKSCARAPDAFFLFAQAQTRAVAVTADAPHLGEDLQKRVSDAAMDLERRCASS